MPESLKMEDILRDRPIDEDTLAAPLAEKSFFIFRIFLLILVLAIVFKLLWIGLFRHERYLKEAAGNINNSSIAQAGRGVITDRFGKKLAENKIGFNVFLYPSDLPEGKEARLLALDSIGEIFNLNPEGLAETSARQKKYLENRILLGSDVSEEVLLRVAAGELPGLKIEESFERSYGLPFVFSHVLGYAGPVRKSDLNADDNLVSTDIVGRDGLERQYDNYLRGSHGIELLTRDSLGVIKERKTIKLPSNGLNLETTIDAEFQEYFFHLMEIALKKLGRQVGVGIAIQPQTGEVLALFNVPSFDASRVAESLSDKNLPLFNRAVSGLYSPGSVIKPLVALAALKEGVIKPSDKIFSAGYIEIPNPFNPELPSVFKDWKPHGWVDLRSALARSSNVYFYEVGGGFQGRAGLGIARLKKWWQKFGLDQKIGIDLPGEAEGFLPDPEWKKRKTGKNWLVGDTYNVSIGQGDLLITPINLLSVISAIAGDGVEMKPHLVKKIYAIDGQIILEKNPEVLRDLKSEIGGVLPEVQAGMRDAVSAPYGTAHILNDLPFPVAGKTGSAQISNNSKTNAFFVGYGPFSEKDEGEKPEIAILILIENAKEGSLNAVPIARDALRWYYENRLAR